MLTLEPAYDQPETMKTLIQEYVDVLVQAMPPFASYLRIQHYDAEVANLRQKYGPPEGRLYIARVDGKAAGCVALRKLDDQRCEMKRLYVRPPFRGKRVGAALTERLVADAREIGYRHMLLDTLPFLTTAIAMYKRMGFYEIPSYNDSPLPETIYLQLDL